MACFIFLMFSCCLFVVCLRLFSSLREILLMTGCVFVGFIWTERCNRCVNWLDFGIDLNRVKVKTRSNVWKRCSSKPSFLFEAISCPFWVSLVFAVEVKCWVRCLTVTASAAFLLLLLRAICHWISFWIFSSNIAQARVRLHGISNTSKN